MSLIAFYNSQFRLNEGTAAPDSDEWTKVRRGRQNFVGHVQPIEPEELGYYDLRDPLILKAQVALAKQHGIRGFCWYAFWSSGRLVNSDALDAMLADIEIDMPFCLCWINGESAEDDSRAFIHDMLRYIKDDRYIRLGEKPVLLVRHPDLLQNTHQLVIDWKSVVRDAECGELHVCAVELNRVDPPATLGFDAWVEMPPGNLLPPRRSAISELRFINTAFRGRAFEYVTLRDSHLAQSHCCRCTYYRTVLARWDTTASSQDGADIAIGSTPSRYQEWLYWAGLQTLLAQPPGRRLLFVNSWNDWANGSILEPDRRYRRGYLEATSDALRILQERAPVFDDYWSAFEVIDRLDTKSASAVRSIILNYERSLAALRGLGLQALEPSHDDWLDSMSLKHLTEIYLQRVHHSLERPQLDVEGTLRGVPVRQLTKAYVRRLADALARRIRTMTSRLGRFMSARPLLSVLMPSYNHAAYVAAAVKSVLDQTINDLELIIIDDGSSDKSPGILSELSAQDSRVQLFLRANRGTPATLNEGALRARGKWIGIINSDDLYRANRLGQMLAALERVDAGWAFSRVDFVDAASNPCPDHQIHWYRQIQNEIETSPTVGFALLKHNVTITTGNFLFEKRLFNLVGGFRELQLVHDWDFALRLLYHSEPIFVDEPLYSYRLHDQNTIRKITQTTTDREVSYVLRDFLLTIALTKPKNVLAPNAITWPGYFEEMVQRLTFQGRPYRAFMPSVQERTFRLAYAR